MATFILVHGGLHGGWCFDRVLPILQARGHVALAPDLPGMGEDKTPHEQVTMALWARTIADLALAQPEKPFLVGHSRGGPVIGEAAELEPDAVAGLIYLTALLFPDGENIHAEIVKTLYDRTIQSPETQTHMVVTPNLAPNFYNRCTPEDAAWAAAKLQAEPYQPCLDPITLTQERWGRLPRAFIECTDDKSLSLDVQRKMQSRAPCDPVLQLDADHSPFLSCPEATVDALEQAAERLGGKR